MDKIYDVAIIGGGPAGLTAAIYSLRSGKSTIMIEKMMIGGQSSLTWEINNFPGFEAISGMDLATKMHEQATSFGLETVYGEVVKVDLKGKVKKLETTDGNIESKSVILAMGAKARPLGVENEQKYIGAGLAYCAICDGSIYRGQKIALVGGGNSAVEDAIYMSKICPSVTMINNLGDFTCQEVLREEIDEQIKAGVIKVYHDSVVTRLIGDRIISGIEFKNTNTGKITTKEVAGVFVAIGRIPDSTFVKDIIKCDERGYIIADENMHTNISGVFVAGDVRVKNLRQVITACGDGAIAATEANTYINALK